MFRKIFILLAVGSCSALFVGCGSDDDSPQTAVDRLEAASTNHLNGQPCGSEVVSDRNNFALTCRTALSSLGDDADLRDCRSKIQSFVDKYPGVNCTALVSSSDSVDDERTTVLESELLDVIELIDTNLAQ